MSQPHNPLALAAARAGSMIAASTVSQLAVSGTPAGLAAAAGTAAGTAAISGLIANGQQKKAARGTWPPV